MSPHTLSVSLITACLALGFLTGGAYARPATVPRTAQAGSQTLVEVAAGPGHSLARRSDGSVVGWGNNSAGQTDVPALPPGLSYVEISAGGATFFEFSVARRSDGSVVAWGDNTFGQCSVPALPPGLTYVEIAAGGLHTLARRSDGSVVAWGDNAVGQTAVPALPPGLTYVEVSAGGTSIYWWWGGFGGTFAPSGYSVARRSDGSVVTWGAFPAAVPALPPGLTYVEISAGSEHVVARLSDGSVVAWGGNWFGQTDVPAPPLGLTYVEIAAGGAHTTARLSDGSVVAWGETSSVSSPPALPPGMTYVEVAAGGETAVAHCITSSCPSPSTYSGYGHSLALRSDGLVVGWGVGTVSPPWDPGGVNYCTSSLNSTGSASLISASGSSSVAINGLVLSAGPGPVSESGIFYYGPNALSGVAFGNGFTCVGGSAGTVVRVYPFVVSDAGGMMSTTLDNTNPVHGQLVPGATLNFQAWFRDPAGGGTGFNLSDGLSVTFVP